MHGTVQVSRVLVVDAYLDTADTLVELLQLAGIDARPAYSLPEALHVSLDFQPEAVIIDVVLRGVSVGEICAAFGGNPQHAPRLLIAHSAVEPHWLSPAEVACFTHFLIKPTAPATMLQLLRQGSLPPQ